MPVKTIVKVGLDMGMTVMLLLLMVYEMIGQAAHEWLGMGIFVLFVARHTLNKIWCGNILEGNTRLFGHGRRRSLWACYDHARFHD